MYRKWFFIKQPDVGIKRRVLRDECRRHGQTGSGGDRGNDRPQEREEHEERADDHDHVETDESD